MPFQPSFGRIQKAFVPENVQPPRSTSVAFPNCNMKGGLCEVLLSSLPMAIIVIQFIRDGYDVVQDGIITVSNEHAVSVFGESEDRLTGSLFLSTCANILPFGAWHRCLWVTSTGKTETMIGKSADGKQPQTLTIAPYGDGLLLAMSLASE